MNTKAPTYREQLLHPKWQKRRLEILNRASFACECCGAEEKTLHVHHKRYAKGRMAWEYEDRELIALCETCHEATHLAKSDLEDALIDLPPRAIAEIAAIARGVADFDYSSEPSIMAHQHRAGQIAWVIADFPASASKKLLDLLLLHGPDSDFWDLGA